MKVKNCPNCGSLNFVKKGFNFYKNSKIQRYFCKDCNYKFQPKIELPSWVNKAYNDYVFKGMIYKDLTKKYNKSIPTLTKYFDILNNKVNRLNKNNKQQLNKNNKQQLNKNNKQQLNKNNNKQPINLIFDATFFKRK